MTTTIIPPAHLERIYHLLTATYGEPAWIPDYDALGGLVGTILSQHTSDINSERAYQQLVATFPGWEEVRDAPTSSYSDRTAAGSRAKRVPFSLPLRRAYRALVRRCLALLAPPAGCRPQDGCVRIDV